MYGRVNHCESADGGADTKQHPIKHSFCVSLRRDVHWKSLILSLLIYGCLVAIAWCRLATITTVVVYYNRYASQKVNASSPCADGYIYIPVAFVILLYLVYLVECWHCHTRLELKHKVDVQTVYHKMRQMREALPIVWWKAVCYHYVRRTRQVTRYRNGDAFTSTQVYYERINSHTSGCAFNFTNCGLKDMTKFTTGLEDYPATKIRFSKSYSFVHPDAKYEFDDQRNHFFTDNERRDDYMETREGMDLLNVNFKEYMIAFKDPDNLPWYVSHVVFWLASCLLLTWPLRVIIEFKTAYIHYHVHKVFGTNYANSEQQSSTQMTRVNTIASAELDMIVRNNFTVVPSYSEALLIDANATSSYTLHDANANVTSPVLGPTRSITWNNISASTSSGYISGFFSSGNIPQYSSCTLVNEGVIVQSEVDRDNTTTNTIRNLFRSPWNRKRKHIPVTGNNQNTMFMLSSPESPDDYTLAANQQLPSAAQSPHNHSSICEMMPKANRRTSHSLDNHKTQSSHSLSFGQSNGGQSLSLIAPSCSETDSNMQTIVEVCTPKRKFNASEINKNFTISKPVRPISIPNSDKLLKQNKGSAGNTRSQNQAFIKSNLPIVPISNILAEKSPTIDLPSATPNSPPGYEEALHMQKPNASLTREANMSERQPLFNSEDRSRRSYNAMMETSL